MRSQACYRYNRRDKKRGTSFSATLRNESVKTVVIECGNPNGLPVEVAATAGSEGG